MLWLWIAVGIAVLLLLLLVIGYNRLVRLRQEANTGWANIEVQLERRADLIPNLVEAVKGYASHERELFQRVTEARSALQRASGPQAAAQADDFLTGMLARLFAVAEAYPELKASQNFLQLQEELTDTEDKISAARRYYNATVMRFNTAIQSFPAVVYSSLLGFKAREFFAAEDEAREAPQVELTRS